MKPRRPVYPAALLMLVLCASAANATDTHPIQQHMHRMLTADEQWRSDNPFVGTEQDGPRQFGLRFELQPDGTHVAGNLTGLYADGRELVYWTLLAFYNPVTQKIIMQQIGWNGDFIYGEVPVQTGDTHIVDAMTYGTTGNVSYSRHKNIFDKPDQHRSVVYEKSTDGWKQVQDWTWRRHGASGNAKLEAVPTAAASPALEKRVGYLLAGTGQWRAANPEYQAGSDDAKYFGMNYRWGINRQHVVGEIISIYADGRLEKDWSKYISYNPVTERVFMQQTGANGVYFHGELEEARDGRSVHGGIVHIPNGTVKSVRDEIERPDDRTFISHVLERDANGDWREARQWVWRLQSEDDLAHSRISLETSCEDCN